MNNQKNNSNQFRYAKKPNRNQNNQTKNGQTEERVKQPKIQVATSTRRGEVLRAQRMVASDVVQRASQHIIENPVNKSIFNGNSGEQVTLGTLKKSRYNPDAVRILPIGGYAEIGIGKNMTGLEYQNDLVLVDMGSIFPNENYPGVNYMIPDMTYVEQNIHKLKALILETAFLMIVQLERSYMRLHI